MDGDDGLEDEGPFFAWIPPDDRLWRHPSEVVPSEALAGAEGPRRRFPILRAPQGRTWGVAVVAGLVGALLASSVGMVTGAFEHKTTVVSPVRVMTPNTLARADTSTAPVDWPSVADSLAPSIVAIRASSEQGPLAGSGLVYVDSANRTFILTDEQLVDAGGPIRVVFNDGSAESGHLLRTDAKTGLALLWVGGGNRQIPNFGTIGDVRVADTVMAIGAGVPAGGAVAPGTVSGLDWSVNLQDGSSRVGLVALTAASMPPETAGGPVVDRWGTIVGIATPRASTDPNQQGFSYAVPIDVAEHVATDILSGRPPTHPWLGLYNLTDLSTAAAHSLGVPGGVQVNALAVRSPAVLAGVSPADIVTAFNGQPISSTGELTELLSRCEPGQTGNLSYLHRGKPVTVTVTVAEQRDPDGS